MPSTHVPPYARAITPALIDRRDQCSDASGARLRLQRRGDQSGDATEDDDAGGAD
jgi:hypothetical protein